MKSSEVRRRFLEFFSSREHQLVPSSPLILPSDPTLLFANAGMNQFKEVFRGVEQRPYRRATSSQKCLRVSGKHNDLEEVGRTPRHHTFFEMLGNFSFGDYFKHEAIRWAWELVTEELGVDPARLSATVFAGDDEFPGDEEAAEIWRREIGLPAGRVVALPRKENFWQMGETGPAGPCSELHFDLEPDGPSGEDPGSAPDRFLEIWNLVFMQYDLQPGGGAEALPAPCVDTGAGLERLTAVLSGVGSNYDTDLFLPIIASLAGEAGVSYGADPERDVSLRVIADHLRAIAMLVAEGVIPGPEKRGAVLRRILRRALRHGRLLGLPVPFLHRHLASVRELLGEIYPELERQREVTERIVRREEERFDRTLADGFERLEERIADLIGRGEKVLGGEEAFVLESERGLPFDLIVDALEERDLELDRESYEAARRRHVQASRVRRDEVPSGSEGRAYEAWSGLGSEFDGYLHERLEAVRVLGLLAPPGQPSAEGGVLPSLREGQEGELLLDRTPFYAESGGQVGDRGLIIGPSGRARVLNARSPRPGLIAHRVLVEQGSLAVGDVVVAEVDHDRRQAARRHHTATHLLHAALGEVLGSHVKQSGSLVAPDRLRFDFSHFEAVTHDELAEIEDRVNDAVLADHPVSTEELPLEQALASGATAFFGDRYGEKVRVIRVAEVSAELCGGTHVSRTGEIGPFRIVGERGVAAGVRRIEALAGPLALRRAREERRLLEGIVSRLGGGSDPLAAIDARLESLRELQRENAALKMKLARGESGPAGGEVLVDGIAVVARRADGLDRSQRRDLADSLRSRHTDAVVVLGAEDSGKAALLVALGEKVRDRLDARALIRIIAKKVDGGGGGRPDLAEAGGKTPAGLDAALAAAPSAVEELLGKG